LAQGVEGGIPIIECPAVTARRGLARGGGEEGGYSLGKTLNNLICFLIPLGVFICAYRNPALCAWTINSDYHLVVGTL